eukprot:7768923-Alexandrium_andersonii.AAC.1
MGKAVRAVRMDTGSGVRELTPIEAARASPSRSPTWKQRRRRPWGPAVDLHQTWLRMEPVE